MKGKAKKRAADEGFIAPAPKRTRTTRAERHVDDAVPEQSDKQLAPSAVVGEDQAQQSERPLLSESVPSEDTRACSCEEGQG